MTDESTPEPVALQARLDQLEQKVADYKLLLADHQNAAKRLKDDADRQRRYATEPVMKDLLPVYDNLELAAKAAEKGGDSGPAAMAKDPANSLLVRAVKYDGLQMPPDKKLPDEEIARLAKWVEMGLPWPADPAATPVADAPGDWPGGSDDGRAVGAPGGHHRGREGVRRQGGAARGEEGGGEGHR